MKKSIETGEDKVKKICDVLRRETLAPAKQEAEAIIANAHEQAKEILAAAKQKIETLHVEARKKIEEERSLFTASIHVACKKSLGQLKQEIEEKLFGEEIKKLLEKPLKDSAVIAKLITAIVKAIDKEGIDVDLHAVIPKEVPAEEVNRALTKNILERLSDKGVQLGALSGGAEVKILNRDLTIDISLNAVQALLAHYVRDSFRSIVFST